MLAKSVFLYICFYSKPSQMVHFIWDLQVFHVGQEARHQADNLVCVQVTAQSHKLSDSNWLCWGPEVQITVWLTAHSFHHKSLTGFGGQPFHQTALWARLPTCCHADPCSELSGATSLSIIDSTCVTLTESWAEGYLGKPHLWFRRYRWRRGPCNTGQVFKDGTLCFEV